MKKKVLGLMVLTLVGLSSFAQITMQPKSPLFRPNEISIIFRSMETFRLVSDIETIGTFSMKVLIGKKCKKMELGGGQDFSYKGKIADTMRCVFDAPDYQRDTFTYYKKIHYDPYAFTAFFHITPKGLQVNKIVILGDAVDVYVGGEKYSYTV